MKFNYKPRWLSCYKPIHLVTSDWSEASFFYNQGAVAVTIMNIFHSEQLPELNSILCFKHLSTIPTMEIKTMRNKPESSSSSPARNVRASICQCSAPREKKIKSPCRNYFRFKWEKLFWLGKGFSKWKFSCHFAPTHPSLGKRPCHVKTYTVQFDHWS